MGVLTSNRGGTARYVGVPSLAAACAWLLAAVLVASVALKLSSPWAFLERLALLLGLNMRTEATALLIIVGLIASYEVLASVCLVSARYRRLGSWLVGILLFGGLLAS